MTDKVFTSDWFSHNIPNWKANIDSSVPMDVLELGVFEGRSAIWMLENLNVKSLIAVDLWDEEGLAIGGHFDTEKNFDHNIKSYANATKVKSTTYEFLKANEAMFDLIYIDGNHMGKNVLTDAVMAHQVLKEGGYLVFDDYSQSTDSIRIDRPRGAINAFLHQFADDYQILHKGYQVIAQKKVIG